MTRLRQTRGGRYGGSLTHSSYTTTWDTTRRVKHAHLNDMVKGWGAGDIVMVEPGEATDFVAITDAVNVVVKMPSVMGDKYLGTLLA